MFKILLRVFLIILVLVILFITYLSIFGIKTDKFNQTIKSQIVKLDNRLDLNLISVFIKLNLNERSFSINSKNLELFILNENQKIKNLDILLDLKSLIGRENKIKKIKFDNIFITTKINTDLKKIFLDIEKNIYNKTLIVTPCTSIPFWWYKCLNKNIHPKIEKKLYPLYLKNINRKNLIGMTMWLSGKIESPGNVIISHVQRGFPIKELFFEKKQDVDALRKDLKKTTLSPKIKNIFFEIFMKSINSLAFNAIALKYEQSNKELYVNKNAKNEVLKILKEGDKILKKINIKINQSPISRINQTLKSKNHTMSMLNAYKNKEQIELKNLWLSFKVLLKANKFNMKFTEKIIKDVLKKI